MRKPSSILAVSLVLGSALIAGCGGSGGSDASSPLDNALGYLPADAPFAVAIDTDVEGGQFDAAKDTADGLAQGQDVEKLLKGLVEERAGDLKQIEQALGNEFVIGSTDPKTFVDSPSGEDQAFVGAIQAKSQDAVDAILEKQKPEEDGEASGAKLYKDDSGDSFAIDGDTLVVAGSKQELEQALATREDGDGLSEEDFDAGTEGVPADALARVYVNIEALLAASPEAKDALRSKWVKAVQTAGVAISFESGKVAIDLGVKTDSSQLTDADLPIAAGPDAPQVVERPGSINLALRDPGQLLEFAQLTAKAVNPAGFGSFEAGKAQIERRLGISLDDDVIGQLDGDLAVSIALDGKYGARADLKDPAAFKATLKKLEPVLPNIAQGIAGDEVGFAKPKGGSDFYAIATAGGSQTVFGVVGDVFVISNSPAIAGAMAAAEPQTVPGAKGALVLSADATQIARTALAQSKGLAADRGFDLAGLADPQKLAGPLGDLIGSIEATTDGLTGGFELTVERRNR